MPVDVVYIRRLLDLYNENGTHRFDVDVTLVGEFPAVLDELEALRAEHAACKIVQTLENAVCGICGYPDQRMIGAFGPVCPNCGAGIDEAHDTMRRRRIAPAETRTHGVVNCARCGGDHAALIYKKLQQPIEDGDLTLWEWWTLCPVTEEPILMRVYHSADEPSD